MKLLLNLNFLKKYPHISNFLDPDTYKSPLSIAHPLKEMVSILKPSTPETLVFLYLSEYGVHCLILS